MIIDLDAHQGNGHERDFMKDKDVFIIDFYNPDIFPNDEYAKDGIDVYCHIDERTNDEQYIDKMEELIPSAISKFLPDFIVYNAGTDILEGDQLGGCRISGNGIVRRDEKVFEYAFGYKIPILMVLSGGYMQENAPIIARSINNIFLQYRLES